MSDQDYLDKLRAAWPLLNSPPSRPRTQVLSMAGTLGPNETGELQVTPQAPFRANRLVVSTHSYQVGLVRKLINLPMIVLGVVTLWVVGRLVRWLHINLEPTFTDQVVAEDDPRWLDDSLDIDYYDDEDRPVIRLEQPPTRRERWGRAGHRLGIRWRTVNHRYRLSLMRHLQLLQVVVGTSLQLSGPVPAELFSPTAMDAGVTLDPCAAGTPIRITVRNTHRRKSCNVAIGIIGHTL